MEEAKADNLTTLVQYFEDAEDSTSDSRKLSERDADYYDGIQLTAEELKVLARRKQPPVINNRIKPKIDFMLGQELKTRTDPKAYPRNPQVDEDAASACTDALRYVCDKTKFERVRSLCYEDGLKYGTYCAQMVVTPKGKDYELSLVHVPWDRLFWDPHSRAKDFSDAKYKGIVIWQDRNDALDSKLYTAKDKESVLSGDASGSSANTSTYDDKPQNRWIDAKRNRVRVVYMEYLDKGQWYHCYFTKAGFLKKPTLMPFVDDDGFTVPSLEFQSLFVDRDGNRYGQIRQYISMQDEINKRRSKGLHLLNSRQTIGEKGAVTDINAMKRELAKPDGHVDVNPGMKFDVVPTNDMAAGNFNMLQEAKAEIDAQGPNAAMVGAEKRDLSGRAIQALQSGGNTETSIQTDGLRDWEHRIYRLVWYCIKKYWTSEKWIRVTDDDNSPKYVGLNTPTTNGEQMIAQLKKQGEEITPEQAQQIMQDPRAQQIVIQNNVAELDVDIILEDVPDTVTIQQEQFEQLGQLFPAMPDNLKPLGLEMMIAASSLRNKKQLIEKLQGKNEEKPPVDPIEEEIKLLTVEKLRREVANLRTVGIKNLADAEAKEVGTQVQVYTAEVQAMQPQGAGMAPQAPQAAPPMPRPAQGRQMAPMMPQVQEQFAPPAPATNDPLAGNQ